MNTGNEAIRARPIKNRKTRFVTERKRAKLCSNAWTMQRIREAGSILAEDLAEIARRVNHPEGRRGYRARELVSEIGIHGYPQETISIHLPSASDGGNIHVLHHIDNLNKMRVSLTIDKTIVLRLRNTANLQDLPSSLVDGLKGGPVERLIDFSKTSIPQMNKATITAIYTNTDQETIYAKGDWTEYDLEIFAAELIAENARMKSGR